jgi:hypothetical protein
MDTNTFPNIVPILVLVVFVFVFARRRTKKEVAENETLIVEEYIPDPRLQQDYYIAQGHDMNSSFYEVRQYEEDLHPFESVEAEWSMPWIPGLDRELALVLTGDFSQEQYSRYWQTIIVLDCKHYLPSVHAIVSMWPHGIYCFICRGLSGVVKTVTRKEIFPSEGDSIKSRVDWARAAFIARNQDKS